MDLQILLLFDHGRKRTANEFATRLAGSVLRLEQIILTRSPVGLAKLVAVRQCE